ncbi:MAG: queuosine precursor transporter [Firmicutes bacterium]|nr:queuosine precursor transporter [Bacillota bacterium]
MAVDKRLLFLSGLFITLLIASNLMAVKFIAIGTVVLPAAVICYPLCFVASDLINEFYGFKTTKKVILFAFIFNALVVGLTALAVVLPPAPGYEHNEAFKTIFLSTPLILGASFLAFAVGGILNSYVFNKIRKKNKPLALRSVVSTFLGIIVDSFIFITLVCMFDTPFGELMLLVLWQVLAKIIVGIGLGTPLTLLTVKLHNKYQKYQANKRTPPTQNTPTTKTAPPTQEISPPETETTAQNTPPPENHP